MGTLSPLRKVILIVGGLLTLGVVAVSVLSIVDWMGRASYEHDFVLPTEGHHLVVRNTGDIVLTPSPDNQVHVHVRVQYGLYKPTLVQESTSDGVMLESHCRHWIGADSCEVDYSVLVPRSFDVEVIASAGDVSATGLSGTVKLTTSAGNLRAEQMSGELTLRSTAGDVRASDLRSSIVRARTAAGDIALAFSGVPQNVTAQATAGDVRVTVPSGQYQVAASSTAGDEFVDPGLQSSESERKITATSTAGDVTVSPTVG
jgi:DUF4097 and DUF4098 domain-containing protein YvlB